MMIPKEILKMAYDADLEVLEASHKGDEEILEIMNFQISIIWGALIDKNIINMEEAKKYTKLARTLYKNNLDERNNTDEH